MLKKTPKQSTLIHSHNHTKHTQPLKYPFKMFDTVTCMTGQ